MSETPTARHSGAPNPDQGTAGDSVFPQLSTPSVAPVSPGAFPQNPPPTMTWGRGCPSYSSGKDWGCCEPQLPHLSQMPALEPPQKLKPSGTSRKSWLLLFVLQ